MLYWHNAPRLGMPDRHIMGMLVCHSGACSMGWVGASMHALDRQIIRRFYRVCTVRKLNIC